MTTALKTPVININGTSADDLIAAHRAAHESTLFALQAWRDIYPHGRDYQTQPAGALQEAIAAWGVHYSALQAAHVAAATAYVELEQQKQERTS